MSEDHRRLPGELTRREFYDRYGYYPDAPGHPDERTSENALHSMRVELEVGARLLEEGEAVFFDQSYDGELRRYAGERVIERLSEATMSVHSEVMLQYPEIPWGPICQFRHRVVHECREVSPEEVW